MTLAANESISTVRNYINQIAKTSVLEKDVFLSLFAEYKAGSEFAMKKLMEHNLRFVVKVAYKYTDNETLILDLIAEGNIGLARALEKFEPEKGFSFLTYADRWIRFRIEHYLIQNSKSVHVPTHILKIARKVYKTEQRLRQNGVEKVTPELIASETGETKEVVLSMMELNQGALSTDFVMDSSNEKSATIGDMIASEGDCAEEQIEQEESNSWIMLKVGELPVKQRDAIIHHFGLANTEAKTFAEVGRVVGISRERARQLVVEGVESLQLAAKREDLDLEDLIRSA